MAVWLIDAHPLMRAGLKAQLDGKGFAVVAEGASLPELSPREREPHLVVMDMALGLAALGEVKAAQPAARVVVMAEHAELTHLVDAFGAGADGYLLKSISADALVESLRLVALGEKVFPGVITNYLSALGAPANGSGADRVKVGDIPLSTRELDIIRHLADGHSNKTIANELSITEATVKVHLKTVLRKIGVSNRTQVAIWAVQHGIATTRPNGGTRPRR